MSSAEQDGIDSTLSSLFFLRDGSNAITLPRIHTPANKTPARRLLSVVTSIAAICVRQPSEIFACSLSISHNSLEIYLAENHSIDRATSAYLDGILSCLVAISEKQPQDQNASPSLDASWKNHVMDILAVVLDFTLPKFLHSISKHDANWDARMAEIEKLDLLEHERSAFLELQKRIGYVFRFAHRHDSQRSDQSLEDLATSLSYLRALVLESPDKEVIAAMLEKIDLSSPLDGEAMMAEDLDPADMSRGFSLTRYVARMLSIMVHVMRLVKLAVSPTYKDLFTSASAPIIHYLTPVPKSVRIDTGAALQFLDDSSDNSSSESDTSLPSDTFLSANDTIRPITECSHAEITVFQRLLEDALRGPEGLSAHWVIGTSKLMCAGCYATIARAYPKILQDYKSQLGNLRPFLVQGSHGKLYAPWIPPTLSSLDELVGFDFDRRIKAATLDVLKDDLMTIFNSRRLSDSSAGSHVAEEDRMQVFKSATHEAGFLRRAEEISY